MEHIDNVLQEYKIVWKLCTTAGSLMGVILLSFFASLRIVCLINGYLYS